MNNIFFEEKIPIYTIFILILIISANFLAQIFPCKIQKILNCNMYVKHIFSFLTLMFFVILSAPIGGSMRVNDILMKAFILYIFFIILTKTNYIIFMIIIILLGTLYLIILKINELKESNNNDKNELEEKLNNIYNYISYIILILLIIGFLMYMGEKKYEYKNKFEYRKFIFGIPYCSGKNSNMSLINSLKYAF
jgi:hypothetical protein